MWMGIKASDKVYNELQITKVIHEQGTVVYTRSITVTKGR